MDNELYHYGVLGMRWGIRRYQKRDGTLTNSGKKRYDKEMNKLKDEEKKIKNQKRTKAKIDKLEAKRKSIEELKKSSDKKKDDSVKTLSDDELREKVNRLQLEKQYKDLSPKQISLGKAFANTVAKDVVAPVAIDLGKQALKSILVDKINKYEPFSKEGRNLYTNNNKKK